eukprot:scaffold59319_cov41-Prasinocladus_malaysianus.AAC.1
MANATLSHSAIRRSGAAGWVRGEQRRAVAGGAPPGLAQRGQPSERRRPQARNRLFGPAGRWLRLPQAPPRGRPAKRRLVGAGGYYAHASPYDTVGRALSSAAIHTTVKSVASKTWGTCTLGGLLLQHSVAVEIALGAIGFGDRNGSAYYVTVPDKPDRIKSDAVSLVDEAEAASLGPSIFIASTREARVPVHDIKMLDASKLVVRSRAADDVR